MSCSGYIALILVIWLSTFNFVKGETTSNEAESNNNFLFDIKEALKISNDNNTSTITNQNSTTSIALTKSLSLRARFLRIRLRAIIQNLNNTILVAKMSSEEFNKRLIVATEDFTNKLNEDIQLLRSGVEQAVAEAIAKLQSKAVGVYECSQQQIGLADSWIQSSLESLGRCSMPLATSASNAVTNITQAVKIAAEQVQSIVDKMDSCKNINNTDQFETCLSDVLNEAHGIEIKLTTQLGYMLQQATKLVLVLPGTLAACGGSLLANINTGITQAIVSVGKCTVGIVL